MIMICNTASIFVNFKKGFPFIFQKGQNKQLHTYTLLYQYFDKKTAIIQCFIILNSITQNLEFDSISYVALLIQKESGINGSLPKVKTVMK